MGDTKKLTTELYSLAEAVEVSNSAAQSYSKTIGEIAEKNKLWTIASRLLSGTGLWKLQNYVRAAGQALYMFNEANTKAIEKSNEAMIATSKMNDKYKELGGVLKNLKKAQFDDSIFKQMLKENLELKVTYEGLRNAGMKHAEAQKKATKQVVGLYSNQYSKIGKMVDKHRKKTRKALGLDTAETKLEAIRQRKERMKQRQKEIKDYEETLSSPEAGFMSAGQRKHARSRLKGLRTQDKKARQEFTFAGAFGKEMKNMAKGFKNFRKEYFTREKIKQRLAKLRAMRGLTFIKLGAKVGKVMGLALKFSLYFMLFIMGAFIVFSIVRKIFENANAMQGIVDTIQGVIEKVMLILSGVFDLFGAFFGTGTFAERVALLLSGIIKIFGGLMGILLEVAVFAVKMTIGLLFGVLKLVVWDMALKPLFELGVFIGKLIFGIPTKVKEKADKLWEIISGAIFGFLGSIANTIIRALNLIPRVDIPLFAKGGVSKGGMAIVGEQGPELVNLPKGAKVHSNAESRRMGGNTINVNVSGRVGASDSELRDIAKKIGRMVNTEINRTTSSSTNVRY